jgi:PiT family inorganic phosphate transporter
VSTWIVCPILAAVLAALFFLLARRFLSASRLHILELDAWTRVLLIGVGAFGAYSLGANNVANVIGVFIPAFPAETFTVAGSIRITMDQALFLLGGLAIASGVWYSRRVMMTVGRGLYRLTPITALVVVLAHSIVLFVFASGELSAWLSSVGLPTIPLVPVSSSQAIIGAVMGVALVKGGRNVRFGLLGRVASSWVATPVIAGVVAFLGLFFLQNVFNVVVAGPLP